MPAAARKLTSGVGFNPNRNGDGTFAAGQHAEADLELAPTFQKNWRAGAPPLDPDEQRLADGMQRLHAISLTERAWWISDDTFTCDGGAVAVALMARELGIPAKLHVGLYWHTDVELRAEFMGEERSDYEDDEEWQHHLDEIRDSCMDEHHHWVTLHPGEPKELRVDPNGTVRREPYLTRTTEDGAYRDGAEHIMYDPTDPLDQIADRWYPGLLVLVSQALLGARSLAGEESATTEF